MNHDIEIKIGKNIRTIRENRNMTQEEVATKLQVNGCDITRSAYAKIEVAQRHLYVDEIIKLKAILGTDYDTMLNA